jgi:hypothetical protein
MISRGRLLALAKGVQSLRVLRPFMASIWPFSRKRPYRCDLQEGRAARTQTDCARARSQSVFVPSDSTRAYYRICSVMPQSRLGKPH